MKVQPLITVVLPVHNSAQTLAQRLFSILNQTHKNIEVIAIDDFSKDTSYSILKTFKKKGKDTLMTLVHSGLPNNSKGKGHQEGWTYFLDKFTKTLSK